MAKESGFYYKRFKNFLYMAVRGCVEHFPVLCYNYFIYYTDSVPFPGQMMRIPDAVFHFEAALKGKMYAYT